MPSYATGAMLPARSVQCPASRAGAIDVFPGGQQEQVRIALARDARDALRDGGQLAAVDVEVRRLAGADRGGDQRAALADGGRRAQHAHRVVQGAFVTQGRAP